MKLGLTAEQEGELQSVLEHHVDVFRLEFGQDLPVDVELLKVRLKEGAGLVKCVLRRYPPAAAPRTIAKKTPFEYRMTIDSRPINA